MTRVRGPTATGPSITTYGPIAARGSISARAIDDGGRMDRHVSDGVVVVPGIVGSAGTGSPGMR